VPLRDLPRASAFRLGLLFLALFLAAYLILFGFIYWRTAGYLHGEVDVWLKREMAARVASGEAALRQAVEDHLRLDPAGRRPFVLFDAEGHWLAGNPASLPAPLRRLDRPFNFTLPRDTASEPFRGIVHRLASGDIFLVAQDMRDIHEFRDLLLGAMVSGAALVLVIGLGGALAVGAGAVSRIDAVTRAIERIVSGNLSERLPGGGTGGDLARLILVVNRMLDQIERLMREVKGVTEDVAHDLRTPLTRLLAGLERTRRRATTADAYAIAVDEAIAETKGILATFSALLRIAEVEGGARRAGFTRLDLNTVATDVAEFYEPMAEGKGISLSLESAPTPAEIAGDPSLLFEAISNLVDNAIKFTPAGGQVAIRTFDGRGHFGVEVRDTGPGIPQAEREAVLRRFYRAEKSRHTQGSGLGLSLVAAVARLHGLELAIEDAIPGCRVSLQGSNGSLRPAAQKVGITEGA
jgi:signal transduction histidine kinase